MGTENNFAEDLRRYYENTPADTIQNDWDKTKDFDDIGIPADTFVKISEEELIKNKNPNYKYWM